MKQLFLTAFFFLLTAKATAQDTIPGFDRDAWIRDSLGCEGVRHRLVKNITDADALFKGKPLSTIEQLLGPPNGENWYFFDENGPQCMWGSLEGTGWLLYIEPDPQGMVSRVGIIMAD